MEGTLADIGQPRERGSRRHTPQGGPPTPPGLPVSPKWPVSAPPSSPLLLPSLPSTRYCLRELKKQVGSQGGQGWGKRSPRASRGERGPALLPPPPSPRRLAAGGTCARGGGAPGAGRPGSARAVPRCREQARAGAGGRARRGAGPPGAGAGRGSGKRAPSAAAGGVKCARTQRLTASLERSVPGMRTAGSHRATVPRELWRQ